LSIVSLQATRRGSRRDVSLFLLLSFFSAGYLDENGLVA